MSEGKERVYVKYAIEFTEEVFVDIPQGANTKTRAALIESTIEGHTPNTDDMWDWEIEPTIVEWFDEAEHERRDAAKRAVRPVPEAGWVTVPGHAGRWASDGICSIREGAPMPAEMTMYGDEVQDWRTDITGEMLAALLPDDAGPGHAAPSAEFFHRRFAPVLAGASVVVSDRIPRGACVYRDGWLVAMVMPLWEQSPGCVSARGVLVEMEAP